MFSVNKHQTRFYLDDGTPINHDPKNLIPTQELEPWYEENSCFYFFSPDSFQTTAARIGKRVELESVLIDGAFALLSSGDRAGHNQRVIDAIRTLAAKVDVVVCAQGSMAAVLAELGDVGVPVLTSPRLGVESALRILRERAQENSTA